MWRLVLAGALLASMVLMLAGPAAAEAPANDAFQRTWERTDLPVRDGAVSRTWMWGPEAFTGAITEPYAESPDGQRTVQYFDKSRMEITNPDADTSSIWYVTNGLLVVELITGQMQVGDNQFESRSPAQVNVAGDADDPEGPTYATFGSLLNASPAAAGSTVASLVDRSGNVSEDESLAGQGVTIALVDDVTNHSIAAPFWDFINSAGIVLENGQLVQASLFENAYFATGRPIIEPYWANVRVAGTQQIVLVQCFERRCLTYTPDNAPEWQVEAGNVGQHYHAWRYGEGGDTPPAERDEDAIECIREGFPCTLADTPTDRLNRMFDLGEELGDMLQGGATIAELVAHAEGQPDIVEVLADEDAMRFRVEGAPPGWVYDPESLNPDLPETTSTQLSFDPATPLLQNVEPAEVVGKDRDNDDMTDEEPKKVLILSPFRWEWDDNDEGRALRDLLNDVRGYEGNVEYYENVEDENGEIEYGVIEEMFHGWDEYDIVHVSTHGKAVCDFTSETSVVVKCRSTINTGIEASADEGGQDRFFGRGVSFGGETPRIVLSDDFFQWHYPLGLDDTIVFFSACETFPEEYDPEVVVDPSTMHETLAGSSSIFVAWDQPVLAGAAKEYAMNIYTYTSNTGFPFEESVEDIMLVMGPFTYTQKDGAQVATNLRAQAGGDDLRIRETVFQKHPLTDEEVENGDALPIIGHFGDGEEDRLPFVVEVDGVVDPSEFTVHVRINGQDRPETFSLANADQIADNRYRLDEVDVPLGFDAQEDQQIELRIWVDLPEGGETKHTANVRLDNPILEFHSRFDSSSPGGEIRVEVHAEFTLVYNEDFSEVLPGTTTLEYELHEVISPEVPCEIDVETHDGTFEVVHLDFPTGDDGRISSYVPDAAVIRPQNDIYATVTAHCPEGSFVVLEEDIFWFASWVVMHGGADGSLPGAADEFSNAEGAWVIENWQERPIQKVYEQQITMEDGTLAENTTLKITMPDE